MLRLRPAVRLKCAEYDLDVVEIDASADRVEVRLVLGRGLGLYWAAPPGPGERLGLYLFDHAASAITPGWVEDPFWFELERLEWRGELGAIGGGRTLLALSVEVSATPPGYRYVVVTRDASGVEAATILKWSGAS